MRARKEVAERVVVGFDSPESGRQAAVNWEKQFQRDEVPENLETITGRDGDIGASGPEPAAANNHQARIDKLVLKCGLVASASEGQRKIKEKAVRLNGNLVTQPPFAIPNFPFEATVQVGRKLRRVIVIP